MIKRTSVLLPLDKGSILLPTTHQSARTPQLTTIHLDGHIIKVKNRDGEYQHFERMLKDIHWSKSLRSTSWPGSITNLADKQAFGVRINGATVNPLSYQNKTQIKTLELEPLSYGGIPISDAQHVPIGVYLKTGESYRIDAQTEDSTATLSYRPDNHSEWEVIESSNEFEIPYLVSELVGETDMVCIDNPSADQMEKQINEKFGSSHKRSQSQAEELITKHAAINVETAFNETIPQPAPLFEE